MALDFGEIGAKASEIGGSVLEVVLIVVIGLIVIAIVGSITFFAMRRKKWNLIVGIKMPRSDGQVLLSETGKGHYDIKAGIVDIKRKKLKAVGMRPFDVRKYLQGNKYLEVIQISPSEYIPILPKSYQTLDVEEDVITKGKDGKEKIGKQMVKYALMNIEANIEKRKTWKTYMERSAKDRFTIAGFFDKHWRAIEISIILFVVFLGMSILWMRMPSICG